LVVDMEVVVSDASMELSCWRCVLMHHRLWLINFKFLKRY